jgi:hypothetical protein
VNEHKVYLAFDKISPHLRGVISVVLIVAGFLIQLNTRNILAGMPFIVLCLVLNLIRGISVKKPPAGNLKWQEVTPDRIDEVLEHCRRVKRFRSRNLGCFIAFIVLFVFMVGFLLPLVKEIPLPFALTATIINTIVLFSGLAISGRRSAWMPQALDIKAETIKTIMESPVVKRDPSITPAPYLEIGQTSDGSFPNDTRVLFRFKNAPDTFIGLQGQVSINVVKSATYPYFYTVVIARHEFGLLEKYRSLKTMLDRITVETKRTDEVDVIVIRQTTTKTSGYHTDTEAQGYILTRSIEIVKKLLG